MTRFRMWALVLAAAALPACRASIAPRPALEELAARLDSEVPGLLRTYGATGAAVALVHGGEIVRVKGYGLADQATGAPVSAGTVFQAASISKPVTAWAVMKLVEDGILDLDAPVETWLTRWHLPPSTFDDSGVTVRRLLSHTAGLSLGGYPGFDPDAPIPSLEESLSGANSSGVEVRLIKEPGEEFDYSGGGYALLSLLVEEVTGETFEQYVEREVLRPLGMAASSYAWSERLRETLAVGHDRDGMPLPDYRFSGKGCASLYTTAEDLARFVVASCPDAGAPAVLHEETVRQMQSPAAETVGDIHLFFEGMGLGYFIDDGGFVAHTGSNRGWRNVFVLDPASGDGIVVLTNSDAGRNVYIEILRAWATATGERQLRMCVFFERVFRISGGVAALLVLSLFAYMVRAFLHRSRFLARVPFWRDRHSPWWRTALRLLFQVLFPILLAGAWSLVLQPLLRDLSPLTAGWMHFGILAWCTVAAVTGVFPTRSRPDPAAGRFAEP